MELKNKLVYEVVKGENKYSFMMPVGVSYGEVYDVAFEILTDLLKKAEEAKKAMERTDKPAEDKKEEVVEVEVTN